MKDAARSIRLALRAFDTEGGYLRLNRQGIWHGSIYVTPGRYGRKRNFQVDGFY